MSRYDDLNRGITFSIFAAGERGGKREYLESANSYREALEAVKAYGFNCIIQYIDCLEYVHYKEVDDILKDIK